jgi:quercetin dioxygenase-like cupin family protein
VEARLGVADKLGLQQSKAVKAASTNFVRFPADFLEDWHCAHARRYVITLSGRGEVEIGGERRITMEPGRVVLFEDRTGRGHISRALTADWTAVFVQLE